MREKVLITGASGFVGYHLINEALKNNLEVYAAVRKSSDISHLKNLDIKYTELDYSDLNALKKDIGANRYDYIIHAAGVTRALTQADYNRVNATYTQNLAKAAALGNVKKFVLISSLAAIGPLLTLTGIIHDNNPPRPVTAYGKSKLLAEQQLAAIENLNYTILRPTGVYGPRDKDFFIVFKQFAKGLEPYIGRAAQKLSFIYVTDLAAVAVKALFSGQKKAYNVSDGNFYDRYELADISKHILRVNPRKIHLPVNLIKFVAGINQFIGSLRGEMPVLNREKLNELTAVNWTCSIDEAQHDLGFYPQYDLEAGINDTIAWYKANNWM